MERTLTFSIGTIWWWREWSSTIWWFYSNKINFWTL